MKTKDILIHGGLLLLLCTACDDRLENVQEEKPAAGKEIRLGASLGEASTRLNLQDNGTEVAVTWEEGDYIQVFDANNAGGTPFTLQEGAGTQKAVFAGTPAYGYAKGDQLCAVYGDANLMTTDQDGNVVISIMNQNGELNDAYQVLFGETQYQEGITAFQFKHVVTLLKVQFSLPDGVSALNSVTMKTSGAFYKKASLLTSCVPERIRSAYPNAQLGDLINSQENQNNGDYTDIQQSDNITINGDFQADASGIVTVYFYVLPTTYVGEGNNEAYPIRYTPSFTATDASGHTYYMNGNINDNKEIVAGRMYNIRTEFVCPVDFANENEENAGTAENPYRIETAQQFYSLMLRCKFGLNGKTGSYANANYRLEADINMSDVNMEWEPIVLTGATFDGNYHMIEGAPTIRCQQYTGVFGELHGCTVSNLRLYLTYTSFNDDTSDYGWFGILAGYAENSFIENCRNESHILGPFINMGGLIGKMENSHILGCGGGGNRLWSYRPMSYFGGMVAYASGSSSIRACYNYGNPQGTTGILDNGAAYVGGIVGYATDDTTIDACWSFYTLTMEGGVDIRAKEYIIEGDGGTFYTGGIVGGLAGNATLTHSFWNSQYEESIAGNATNEESITGCTQFDYFDGQRVPDTDVVAILNGYITDTEYQFTPDTNYYLIKVITESGE